jgi:hypothetical protein
MIVAIGCLILAVVTRFPANFQSRFDSIEVGQTLDHVKSKLGSPDYDHQTAVHSRSSGYMGPGLGLRKPLPVGTPLRQWLYTVEDLRYQISFEEVAKGDFRVVGLRKYPKDAKF